MKTVMSCWRKHHLTLDTRILVIKTFLFSVFVHILNTVYISNSQLDLIQKLLNDFLWRGWNKIKQSVMIASLSSGGMQMLHVKNVVHSLHVKWFQHLTIDKGLTWSRMIWERVIDVIPENLFQGLCSVPESCLAGLDPFYSSMLHSYAYVNTLFYAKNPNIDLPMNLWGNSRSKAINLKFAKLGFCIVADLPLCQNKIDY